MSERPPLEGADWVAQRLGLGEKGRLRVYELARTGQLPCVRLGRSIKFDPTRVEQWIDAGGTNGNGET